MALRKEGWINGPNKASQAILNAAFLHVRSVPYAVSLRWIFYRLYQDGVYKKNEYEKWADLSSRARHDFYGGWHPGLIADDTRDVVTRNTGYESAGDALENIGDELSKAANIWIDHFYRQQRYVELWFEARAMAAQFRHYTERIDLIPMGGQSSIALRWKMAKRLEQKAEKYGKDIVILYFGDEDLAGHQIEETAREDVGKWSGIEFEVIRCGLTVEQAEKYGIPDSIEKRGYQWEALPDDAARQIITAAIEEYLDADIIEAVKDEEAEIYADWSSKIEEIADELKRRKE